MWLIIRAWWYPHLDQTFKFQSCACRWPLVVLFCIVNSAEALSHTQISPQTYRSYHPSTVDFIKKFAPASAQEIAPSKNPWHFWSPRNRGSWGFQSHGGTPNHPVVMNGHDFVCWWTLRRGLRGILPATIRPSTTSGVLQAGDDLSDAILTWNWCTIHVSSGCKTSVKLMIRGWCYPSY